MAVGQRALGDLAAVIDPGFWEKRRVFLTGHTGFKGSWLTLWLGAMGATVKGLALPPDTQPSLFAAARVTDGIDSEFGDIRDAATVTRAMRAFAPDIVIHMAAQPLVRRSYRDPVGTYATNVMGTVHILEAVRACPSVRAVVTVTTDKCYANREWVWGYREDEPMGGHDPYSSSKGCAELVVAAWRASYFADGAVALASARAGNVIGGGDWAEDRLIPDILRAFAAGQPAGIRNPASTRPWQHVLEPLAGYLVLAERLWRDGAAVAEGWNFGPRDEDARPVGAIADAMAARWGGGARWCQDGEPGPHEAHALKLDVSKAAAHLGWTPRWSLATAIDKIVDWQRAYMAGDDIRAVCLAQIADYSAARSHGPVGMARPSSSEYA